MLSTKRNKIKEFLEHARKQLFKFKRTRRFIYLQQTVEKIWGAYTLLMELLSGQELYSHISVDRTAKSLGRKIKEIERLREDCEMLHVFFYEGKASSDIMVRISDRAIKTIERLSEYSIREEWKGN